VRLRGFVFCPGGSAVWPECWLCDVCAVGHIGCCVGGEYPVGVSISSSSRVPPGYGQCCSSDRLCLCLYVEMEMEMGPVHALQLSKHRIDHDLDPAHSHCLVLGAWFWVFRVQRMYAVAVFSSKPCRVYVHKSNSNSKHRARVAVLRLAFS